MIIWTKDDVEYKGYTLNQYIVYKEFGSNKYKKGKIIGFNLDNLSQYPVYVESDSFGTSFKDRRSFIENSPCIFTNTINVNSCKFECIRFSNIKPTPKFNVKRLKDIIKDLPEDYEVCIGTNGVTLTVDDIIPMEDVKTLKLECNPKDFIEYSEFVIDNEEL